MNEYNLQMLWELQSSFPPIAIVGCISIQLIGHINPVKTFTLD